MTPTDPPDALPALRDTEPSGGIPRDATTSGAGRALRVRRVMRPVPEGIDPMATIREAEEKMDLNGVNWLPVTEAGRCVGILTLQDIRRAQRSQSDPRT